LCVVAEGAETNKQLAVLKAQGRDEVQGYLLGRPMVPGLLAAEPAGLAAQQLSSSAAQ